MAGQSCQGAIAAGGSSLSAPPEQWDPADAGAGGDASHMPPHPAASLCLAPTLREGNLTWRLLLPSELMERGSTRYFFFLVSLGCWSTELQLTLAGCQYCSPATASRVTGPPPGRGNLLPEDRHIVVFTRKGCPGPPLSTLQWADETPRPFPGSPCSSLPACYTHTKCPSRASGRSRC